MRRRAWEFDLLAPVFAKHFLGGDERGGVRRAAPAREGLRGKLAVSAKSQRTGLYAHPLDIYGKALDGAFSRFIETSQGEKRNFLLSFILDGKTHGEEVGNSD